MVRFCLTFLLIFSGLLSSSRAQVGITCPYATITTEVLKETFWQYESTIHAGSGKVVHQGLSHYPAFLYFEYDFKADVHHLGVNFSKIWSLQGSVLEIPFRNQNKFCADLPDASHLHLMYASEVNGERFIYRFVMVDAEDTPFIRPWYELPTVHLNKDRKYSSRDRPWYYFFKRLFRQKQEASVEPLVPIRIEISGGGYYGGINPVFRQFTTIQSDGRLIQEILTAKDGLRVIRKNIPRSELESFAKWIESKGFFELEKAYDCEDHLCTRRLTQKPKPVPLHLLVRYGDRKHLLTVSIWGPDHNKIQYVAYPELINEIVLTVQKMADRIEEE